MGTGSPYAPDEYQVDEGFYDDILSRPHEFVDEWRVRPGEARASWLPGGHVLRIAQEAGSPVAELAVWNANDHTETYAAMRSRIAEGVYVAKHTRLWSDVPQFRPLLTCIGQGGSVANEDAHWHRFWACCSREMLELQGRRGVASCKETMDDALRTIGASDAIVRDVVVLFQGSTVSDDDGRVYVTDDGVAREQSISFYAEMELLVVVSGCLSEGGIGDSPVAPTHGSLAIQIHETGVNPRTFPRWTNWRGGEKLSSP